MVMETDRCGLGCSRLVFGARETSYFPGFQPFSPVFSNGLVSIDRQTQKQCSNSKRAAAQKEPGIEGSLGDSPKEGCCHCGCGSIFGRWISWMTSIHASTPLLTIGDN